MPSTKRVQLAPWMNSSVVKKWQLELDIFKGMTTPVITAAAVRAGAALKTACQDIIFSEPDLDSYQEVAEATTVWADQANVYVGIPRGDSAKAQADHMNQDVFPVIETAFDQAGAQAVKDFESELRLQGAFPQ